MGLRDFIKDRGVDFWQLRFREFGSDEWEIPDVGDNELRPKRIDSKLPKDDIKNRAEVENWPEGIYQLMGRKSNAGYTGSVWTIEVGEEREADDDSEGELSEEERLDIVAERAARRAREDSAVSTPDEARGEVFTRVLDGEIHPDQLDKLAAFLDDWEHSSAGPPSSPGEAAGHLYNLQVAAGNVEGATAVLQEWLRSDAKQDSLFELVQESGGFDVDLETILSVGALKSFDDPRWLGRELMAGARDAANAAEQADPDGLAALREAISLGGSGTADESSTAEQPPKEPADATPEVETAADLDIPAPDDADAAAEPETHSTVQTDPEVADAIESEQDATAAAADDATAEARTVDDVERDLEAQADAAEELDEYPSADEAMAELSEAEDADDEAAATDGGEA